MAVPPTLVEVQRYRHKHLAMQEILYNNILNWAQFVAKEWRLDNAAIADIYFVYDGQRMIIEIKTDFKRSYITSAVRKYSPYCDFLMLAVPFGAWRDDECESLLSFPERSEKLVGILELTETHIIWRKSPLLRDQSR